MVKTPSRAALKAERGRRLAVVGGRLEDDNAAIYAEMHRLSGGRILVFPTASSEPVEVGEETLAVFRSHGFEAEVAPLISGTHRGFLDASSCSAWLIE